ncbi:MAG: sel1 repeat family protein [Magnetococcales bacterium]|nr:sel1 repeat family protein [Magnetococcales bacterium]MBF0321954.1 sel1 repeat family protein [Magnetococcales bacterium]
MDFVDKWSCSLRRPDHFEHQYKTLKLFIILLTILVVEALLVNQSAYADIFAFVDQKGIIHLSDRPGPKYRLLIRFPSKSAPPQDDKEAIKWFRLAAEKGDTDAQVQLGEMYHSGRGVPQDDKEAIKWFQLAAEKGNAHAQRYLRDNNVPFVLDLLLILLMFLL